MFDVEVCEDAFCLRRPGMRCLSSGVDGGFREATEIHSFTVPTGWSEQDLNSYARRRQRRAGFDGHGPTLFTAVSVEHLRGARAGPIEAYATAGISNPAALPLDPGGTSTMDGDGRGHSIGTVNVIVGSTSALGDGALANLLCVATEAKTATLYAKTGFTGTTSDAVVAATDPTGEPAPFSGSATTVGQATRACVREAVLASLSSRYPDDDFPGSVETAEFGVVTDRRAEVFEV